MVARLLTGRTEPEALADLLRPAPLADGTEPEERIIICGTSWERYLALDKALGDDRPGPHFYFLEGDLEIMTTSHEHERVKKWIAGLLEIYFDHAGLDIVPRGQATLRQDLGQAGAEPDESWCIGAEKEIPDLVLEIALTSGGVDKLGLYSRFAVPEVWIWRENKLHIFVLTASARYDSRTRSHLLPDLDVALLNRCVAIRSWRQARQSFRAGLTAPERA